MKRTPFFGSRSSYLFYLSCFAFLPHENEEELSVAIKAAGFALQQGASSRALRLLAAEEILGENNGCDLLESEIGKECKELEAQAKTQPFFLSDNRLGLDELFASNIQKMGAFGRKLAVELRSASMNWSETYRREKNRAGISHPFSTKGEPDIVSGCRSLCEKKKCGLELLFKLWLDPSQHPFYGRFLRLLAEVLWKDRCAQQVEKAQKQLPAITQSVHRPLSRICSSRARVLLENGRPSLLYEGKVIAQTEAVDPELYPLIEKGARFFGSIYHHRLLRYECRKGFENWIQGKDDPRTLRIDGGAARIAQELGCKFKEAPSIFKAILCAQAHLKTDFDDCSRTCLIELRKYRSRSTGREESLEIVLAEQLMPSYTFQTSRGAKLLVPMNELPPFVSAPQYYAGQALLQMLVMEEFTQRSLELARIGSIEILPSRWEDFLHQSDLPQSIFQLTLERWIGSFLILAGRDRYVLGGNFQKEHHFLLAQGKLRKERQRQAKSSVRKRSARLRAYTEIT